LTGCPLRADQGRERSSYAATRPARQAGPQDQPRSAWIGGLAAADEQLRLGIEDLE
jgi:hypothetical protein